MTTKRDIENQIRYAHDTGIEQGIEQGIDRTVAALRQSGMSEEEVQRIIALVKRQESEMAENL